MKHTIKNDNNFKEFESGFKKDLGIDKLRYDLIPHEFLTRLATLYTESAAKYPEDNWRKATIEESVNFKQAAYRHFIKWMFGLDKEEDHGIQCVWNIISWICINEYKN